MTLDLLTVPVGLLLHLLSAAAFAVSGFRIAQRYFKGDSLLIRLISGGLFSYGVMLASSTVLLFAGLFSRVGLLGVSIVLLLLQKRHLRTAIPFDEIREALGRSGQRLKDASLLMRGLILLGLFCFLFQCLRGLIDPPLAWDSLTYHMALPALWIQNAGHTWLRIPDAFDCYSHFMHNGELAVGWLMLAFQTDLLANLVNVPFLILMALCLLGIGRELQLDHGNQPWLLASVLFTPPLFAYLTTQYVVQQVACLEICAALFFMRFLRQGRMADCVTAFVAIGIAAGTKPMALPFAVLSVLVMIVLAFKHRYSIPRIARLVLVAGLASLAFCAPWFLRNMSDAGSPVYPFKIGSGDNVIFEGSPYMEEESKHVKEYIANAQLTNADVYRKAVEDAWQGDVSIVYGYRLPIMFGLGLIGLLVGTVKGPSRGTVVLLAAFCCFELLLYFSSSMSLARLVWAEVSLRFTLFPFAVFCIGSVILLNQAKGRVRQLLLVIFAALYLMDLSYMNTQHFYSMMVPLGLGLGALFLLVISSYVLRILISKPSLRMAGVIVLCLMLGLIALQQLRDSTRYTFYAHHVDLHEFPRKHVPIWKNIDMPSDPQVIAVTAGYRYYGHNWFLYPVMGRRFQNNIRYISPVVEGTMPTYVPGIPIQPVTPDVWIERVKASDANLFYVMHGGTLEEGWARNAKDTFALLYEGRDIAIFEIKR